LLPLAIFGLESGGLNLAISLLVLFLFVTYLALIYWTYLDAKRRIEDPVLVACSVGASLFPFLGTVVYTIVRPPEFIEDRQERELELRAAEIQLRQLIEHSCPHCEYPVERSYLRCPNCERRLRSPCRRCRKPLDPKWGVCPYCEAEVRKPRPERREPARRSERGRAPRQAASGRSQGRSGSRSEPRPARSEPRPTRSEPRPTRSGSRSERSGGADGATRRTPARPSARSPRSTGGASGSFPGSDR
jgi:hypothetical protein